MGGQRYTKRLNEKQITALLKVTCQRPKDKENDILQVLWWPHVPNKFLDILWIICWYFKTYFHQGYELIASFLAVHEVPLCLIYLCHLQTVQHNAYNQDLYAKEFGIKISEKLASVEARVLPAPWVVEHDYYFTTLCCFFFTFSYCFCAIFS